MLVCSPNKPDVLKSDIPSLACLYCTTCVIHREGKDIRPARMSGPLSRHRLLSDILVEDEDTIPWTYVTTLNESSHGDSSTYTSCSAGISSKRRKLYRKRTDNIEVRPTSISTECVEWTDEEELSLCQAVSICLQQTLSQYKSCYHFDTDIDVSDTENDQVPSQLTTNITRELQKLSIPRFFAESFVPFHDLTDVAARIKSSAFRRTFLGFLNSKTRRSQSLLCPDRVNLVNASCNNDESVETKIEVLQDAQITFTSQPEKSSPVKGKPQVVKSNCTHSPPNLIKQSGWRGDERKSAESNCAGPVTERQKTDRLQAEQILQEEKCETFPAPMPYRSSSRLKNKQQVQLSNHHIAIEDENDASLSKIAQDESNVQNVSERGLSSVNPNRVAKVDKLKRHAPKDNCGATTKDCGDDALQAQMSSELGKGGNPRQKRNQTVTGWAEPAELEQPSNQILGRSDTKCRCEIANHLTEENVQEVRTLSRLLSNSSEDMDIKATRSPPQLSGCGKTPLLAAVQPLRKSQNDNEKRSFKAFRKKFLDRCLEVQHSRLGPAANTSHRSSRSSNIRGHLDEYLTMQQVQQSRKSLLDACLMAQRETS
ncbi:uncharacterized protein LOC110982531 isoform X2 [Acanthaster planci]|uniref:Uncharacterized protein LOC110982531 isoform X2 n=1 Tax=Acanthaster planci TaxID=133434 RepID=A0A8B7YZS5_ACAPL|nr:uncharacterized protein LOC110982531 isoform X2 [Acanthaster planci]